VRRKVSLPHSRPCSGRRQLPPDGTGDPPADYSGQYGGDDPSHRVSGVAKFGGLDEVAEDSGYAGS
jgi:hypothetical protein